MRHYIAIFGLLFSIQGKADCDLTKGGMDSWVEKTRVDIDSTDAKKAIHAVLNVTKKYCDENISLNEVYCRPIKPKDPMSKACYLESKEGFFFVTQDMIDTSIIGGIKNHVYTRTVAGIYNIYRI